MRDHATGAPISGCFQPNIFNYRAFDHGKTWYAFCYEPKRHENEYSRATCYWSNDTLRSWHTEKRYDCFPSNGTGIGRIRWVLYNRKNNKFVGFAQQYTQNFQVTNPP